MASPAARSFPSTRASSSLLVCQGKLEAAMRNAWGFSVTRSARAGRAGAAKAPRTMAARNSTTAIRLRRMMQITSIGRGIPEARLSFHPTGGDTLDEPTLDKDVNGQDRQDDDHGAGHDDRILGDKAEVVAGQADRQGVMIGRGGDEARHQERVPGALELKHGQRGQGGPRQR